MPKIDATAFPASLFAVADVVDAEVAALDGVARTPPWTLLEGGRLVLVELAAPDLYISKVWLVELLLFSSCPWTEMIS